MSEGFAGWAVVEVMGHKTYAGQVREEVIAGTAFVRIDVPETSRKPAYTKYIGTGSIYAISPTSEAAARIAAMRLDEPPVNPYLIPIEYQLPAKVDGELVPSAEQVAEMQSLLGDHHYSDDEDDVDDEWGESFEDNDDDDAVWSADWGTDWPDGDDDEDDLDEGDEPDDDDPDDTPEPGPDGGAAAPAAEVPF